MVKVSEMGKERERSFLLYCLVCNLSNNISYLEEIRIGMLLILWNSSPVPFIFSILPTTISGKILIILHLSPSFSFSLLPHILFVYKVQNCFVL